MLAWLVNSNTSLHLHCIATFTSSSWLLADKLDNSLVKILHINGFANQLL